MWKSSIALAIAAWLIRERLGYDKEIVERHVAHGSDEELGDAYDRMQFIEPRQRMSQDWADYPDRLVNDRQKHDDEPLDSAKECASSADGAVIKARRDVWEPMAARMGMVTGTLDT